MPQKSAILRASKTRFTRIDAATDREGQHGPSGTPLGTLGTGSRYYKNGPQGTSGTGQRYIENSTFRPTRGGQASRITFIHSLTF